MVSKWILHRFIVIVDSNSRFLRIFLEFWTRNFRDLACQAKVVQQVAELGVDSCWPTLPSLEHETLWLFWMFASQTQRKFQVSLTMSFLDLQETCFSGSF